MARDGRGLLLERVVDHLSEAGLNGITLRSLATSVGTSHRMLLYHFGSFDGLLEAVVGEVEARQRTYFAQLAGTEDMSLAEFAMAYWTHISAAELHPFERLFFGLYARLLQQGDDQLGAEMVRSWIDPTVELLAEQGMDRDLAHRQARLGLAVTRGLLLDLLATGDRAAVDAAMRTHIEAIYGPLPS